ncbi:hypothetical protein SBRY_10930 [Actinacidiphila bryophytorum]|uniref:Uncharacterized protein n=1 Tax=Actinacidiphila bryophytorum TaxID=1436133 RepID=A0A9W4E2B2_9ACTN|nr:hypothetical protein SBRY_10930 [Actinacidiphila bryophytorum]
MDRESATVGHHFPAGVRGQFTTGARTGPRAQDPGDRAADLRPRLPAGQPGGRGRRAPLQRARHRRLAGPGLGRTPAGGAGIRGGSRAVARAGLRRGRRHHVCAARRGPARGTAALGRRGAVRRAARGRRPRDGRRGTGGLHPCAPLARVRLRTAEPGPVPGGTAGRRPGGAAHQPETARGGAGHRPETRTAAPGERDTQPRPRPRLAPPPPGDREVRLTKARPLRRPARGGAPQTRTAAKPAPSGRPVPANSRGRCWVPSASAVIRRPGPRARAVI